MTGLKVLEQNSIQNIANIDNLESSLLEIVEKLDFLDVQLLRKFYTTGKEYPFDTQPYCFPILYKEMRDAQHLKIGMEALRKRLDNLVKLNLLGKIKKSNPTNYEPIDGKEKVVRAIIMKFFVISGLTKFL
ncbi:MAG: hypothetical protein V1870_03315 [Candidatus Aenigmatarchaeota archaeon]